jgi:hypothetical protein
MSSTIASMSGQLARPGAHLVDLEERIVLVPRAYQRVTTAEPPHRSEPSADPAKTSTREIEWACEWWPPT